MQDLGNVKIEKVTVKNRLQNTSNNDNVINVAFSVIPVHPVHDVQRLIKPKCEQIMSGYIFSLASLGHHEELREDGNCFEVDGEGPQYLKSLELVIEKQREDGARDQNEF